MPAPIHRLVTSIGDFDCPTDAFYSCLGGNWDVDGDGLVAEWEEDEADPTVNIMLGRLPADDAQSVATLVAKIIAYEERPLATSDRALFVSSLWDPFWQPGDLYPSWIMATVMALSDSAATIRPSLQVETLYQGSEPVDPWNDPLNPTTLVEVLGNHPHDLVHIQLNGVAQGWELAGLVQFRSEDCDPLAGTGHSFLATMTSGPVGDTRGENILQIMLNMPDGGAAGVIAPTGMGFLFPLLEFRDPLWRGLLDGNNDRLGEAFVSALDAFRDEVTFSSYIASTYWTLAILGDPATMLRPLAEMAAPVPPPVSAMHLRAVPNPFNPSTEIRFEVPGGNHAVKVEIFNLQGRRVATLLDQPLSPGPHSVTWNAGTASGLYFARVTVGGRSASLKLTLLE